MPETVYVGKACASSKTSVLGMEIVKTAAKTRAQETSSVNVTKNESLRIVF